MLLKLLQIWALFSLFDYWNEFSFTFIILSIISYKWINNLDKHYGRIPARTIWDMCYMAWFIMIWLFISWNLLANFGNIMAQLIFSLMYVYWKRETINTIQMWGISIKVSYLPGVVLVLAKISGLPISIILTGFIIGHLYAMLKFEFPERYQLNLIRTPRWFKWIMINILGKWLGFKNKRHQQASEVISFYLKDIL